MSLTDSKVKYLRARKERYIHWEGATGFGVRVAPSGRKTFILMYRFAGTARMMSIGVYPTMTLAEARTKAAQAKEDVTKGIDPARNLVHARKVDREAPTIVDLAEEYLDKWARPRKRSAREDERILRKDVIPAWGGWKAKAVTRRDVIELLDNVVSRGAPIQANRALAVIRKMFNFASGRDIIPASPCTAISSPSKETKRARVMSEDEIRSFWHGLARAHMTEASRLALKFQLATGQRKGEIIQARWEEFDFAANIWTVPADNAKNTIAHRVPLSLLALDILAAIKTESGDSPFLFPSPKNEAKSMGPTSVNHAMRRNLGVMGINNVTPHDLRRTAASFMASLGVPRLVVGKILNHAENGVTAVYDRHSYDKEKREALEAWDQRLQSIITTLHGSVVPISSRRKRG